MTEDDLSTLELGRLVGNEILGLGFVPANNVAMFCLANNVTAYISVDEDGNLKLEIEAPVLQ